jgi:hypothetical protein
MLENPREIVAAKNSCDIHLLVDPMIYWVQIERRLNHDWLVLCLFAESPPRITDF